MKSYVSNKKTSFNQKIKIIMFSNFLSIHPCIPYFLSVFAGICYACLLYTSKIYTLQTHRPILDIIFGVLRFVMLLFTLYHIVTNVEQNSILLLILFVSSYLSTIGILVYTSQ